VFLNHGRKVLEIGMADIEQRFAKVTTTPGNLEAARALQPLRELITLAGVELIFDGIDRETLAAHGTVSTPNLAELFVAVVEGKR
jgi:ABC-2 type transport system ATP-binding protein